ncbi:aprataxin and PNK-like factor isoform X2 [Cheilinus undulatus]|uniref:aprataxin and PNK-like factor isoform X2 n=1 Tax=Cheilinus undulatus TaxID=241271 RepID=UPI001BD460FA|nr:aprataxin and PNK-like factor isoform X2 [Cheilinus undulatus]
MSGFALEPVGGGAPIQLPPGETVLGRGPFLGVSDRRVSRNHGLLENQDSQLRLRPTHFNPCFVQSSLTDSPRALQKGSWHPLHHGDFFSLLPGQFIYKVVAVGGEEEEHTPRNSQMFEEEGPVSPQPDEEPPPPPPPPHDEKQQREQTPLQEEDEAKDPLNQKEAEKPSTSVKKAYLAPPTQMAPDRGEVTASKQRRRVLPAWMMAAAAGSSSSPKVEKKHKAPAAAAPSSKRAAAKKAPPAEASSPEEAELSEEEEERPKKKRRKESKGEERAGPKTDAPSERPALQAKSSRCEVSDESDSFPMDVEEEGRGGETSTADINTTAQTSAVSQADKEDKKLKNGGQTSKKGESVGSNSSPAPTKPRRRTPCPYGKDCYRKNPLHRKEYKHTQKPASTMRTRPKKPPADNEDEEDGSEYEDSFINDDSEEEEEEEGGDDSDYVPPASDDSEKEDIRRLQREAQAFLKKKK